ncbi:MAG: dihydroorotate dehydrogenase electron transfer subunit [Solirubrobacterales bacterium]
MSRQTAPFGRRLVRVTGNDELGAYRVLRLADPHGPQPDPGQFAMLAAADRWGGGEGERPYLPRAFSIARWRDGEAHFLLEDVGPGTRRLCELQPGEGVWMLGPLGVGFSAPLEGRRAILVGGGAGIAPLAIWQDTLGAEATALLGFRDRHRAKGAGLLQGARVATDDGSLGHEGYVTGLLGEELIRDSHATVYACGPAWMLEFVRRICAEHEVPAQLALESDMACGFGACFGCVVPTSSGDYLRVCVDGPVVDAAALDCVVPSAGAPE